MYDLWKVTSVGESLIDTRNVESELAAIACEKFDLSPSQWERNEDGELWSKIDNDSCCVIEKRYERQVNNG